MEPLKLYWLGPPTVQLAGRAVKLETRKAAALLAYLSLSSAGCSREQIATLLWPEKSQQKALANLRRNLSSLNTRLPGWIAADRDTLSLKKDNKLWVDVDAFQHSIAAFQDHDHPGDDLCDGCLASLEQAARCYCGDFLEGLNLPDSPGFDEWQFFQRDGLRQGYAAVLQHLAQGHAQQGEWEPAISYARRWVALDPLNEPANRVLMDLYDRSGQMTAALRQYEELAQRVNADLGLEPEMETRQLYEQVRSRNKVQEVQHQTPTFPLLKTKLYIPSSPTSRVVRSRLVDRLKDVENKALTLISAPAGFGKTTLLAEWLGQTSLPVGWLSLDSGDNDVYRFLGYLIAALESLHEGIGKEARLIMESQRLVPPHIVLASVINDLGKVAEPAVLVLDDYQFIVENDVHETIAYLLDYLPPSLHILISSRADPPLQLSRLRVQEQILEFRTRDLKFTLHETVDFLNKVMRLGLTEQDIAVLMDRTEGWVVGLKMAAISLKGCENASEFIRGFSGSHRYVLDYLMEEVLKRQPNHIQSFLLETSILQKLNAALCDGLTIGERRRPGESSQSVLEHLESNNLFLVSLDDERKWFRYHHLFADLLQSRLMQNHPETISILHRRAATWYAEHQFAIEAVDHALAAKDFTLAADFIEKFSFQLIARSEVTLINQWMNALPADYFKSRPRLVLYHGWILARMGDFKNMANRVGEAETLFRTTQQAFDDELRNYLVQLRTYMANLDGDPDLAIQVASCDQKPPEFPPDSLQIPHYLVSFQLGFAHYMKGELDTAEKIYQSVVETAKLFKDIYNTIITNVELADIQLLRGSMETAAQIYVHTREWLRGEVEHPAILESILKICQAKIHMERNELVEAGCLVQEGIKDALAGFRTNTLAHGYAIQAQLLRIQGDLLRARYAVEQANQWVEKHRTYPRTRTFIKICQIDQWLAEGDMTSVQRWVLEEFPTTNRTPCFYQELEHIALARILIIGQQFEEGFGLLKKLEDAAKQGGRVARLSKIYVLQTLALNGAGKTHQALEVLMKSLRIAQSGGYIRVYLDEGYPMRMILTRSLTQIRKDTLQDYIKLLLYHFDREHSFSFQP